MATEALDRICALYVIEREIRGRLPHERCAVRQERTRPLFDAMKAWLELTLRSLSQKSVAAKAIRYALHRSTALGLYCDDGRIEIDNDAAERALRCVAVGCRSFMLAGSDAGGERAAAMYSLLGGAKLNGHNFEAYMREVLTRIPDLPITRIYELPPWNLTATQTNALTGNGATPKLPPYGRPASFGQSRLRRYDGLRRTRAHRQFNDSALLRLAADHWPRGAHGIAATHALRAAKRGLPKVRAPLLLRRVLLGGPIPGSA
jgi:hypothetical protein